MKKIRVRNHRVVLNRSKGGDFGINIMLLLIGAFMFIPMIYSVMNAFKPLEEFFYFPPHFFPRRLTLENFTYLFQLMSSSWVPFSRYIFNTVFITVAGVLGNLIISSLCAYALSKIPFPGHKFFFQLIQKSLMFSATVAGIINFISMSLLGWVDSYLAIIVPAWATTTGLYLMKQFMDSNVSDAVLESARLDGFERVQYILPHCNAYGKTRMAYAYHLFVPGTLADRIEHLYLQRRAQNRKLCNRTDTVGRCGS